MKNYILLLLIFIPTLSFSQSNWQNGFDKGYAEGYCYNDIGCVSPPSPASIPSIYSTYNNLQDGYNQGFIEGLFDKAVSSSSDGTSSDRTRYKTATPTFVHDMIPEYNADLASSVLAEYDKKLEVNLAYGKLLKMKISLLKAHTKDTLLIKGLNTGLRWIEILEKPVNVNFGYSSMKDFENWIMEAEKVIYMSTYNEDKESYFVKSTCPLFDSGDQGQYVDLGQVTILDKIVIEKVYNTVSRVRVISKDKEDRRGLIFNKYILRGNKEDDISAVSQLFRDSKYVEVILELEPFEKKIELSELNDKAIIFKTYSLLTYSHYYLKNFTEAIQYSTLAINNSSSTNNGEFYFIRGLSKSNIGDYYGSNNDYSYLMDNYSKINYKANSLATIYNNKAYNFILLKNYTEAKRLIDRALTLDSKTAYIWETKGELEYHLGNYLETISAMDKCITIEPTANAYFLKGLAEIALGFKEKGCSALSKAGEMGKREAYTEIKNNCN